MKIWVAQWDDHGLAAYASKEALMRKIPQYVWEDASIDGYAAIDQPTHVYIDDLVSAKEVDLIE